MDEDAITIEEAAKILGVTPDRVVQWTNAGVLAVRATGPNNYHDIGLPQLRLIPRKAVEEFAARAKSPDATAEVPKGLHQ